MRWRISSLVVAATLGGAVAAGCVEGHIGGDAKDPAATQPQSCNGEVGLTATPLRRLTHAEYNRTVLALLGDATQPADAFGSETSATGFNNNAANLGVNPALAEQYMRGAEDIATRAVADLDNLLPCDPVGDEDGCASAFIADFVMRAFRRPLTDEETERFEDLYATSKAAYGFDKAIELVVQAALQSPSFLYRVELSTDEEGALVMLSGHEMATRLSYFLWGTMPDAELFAAASAGELATEAQVEAQAVRMLADDKARDVVASFHEQWLRLQNLDALNKDAAAFPAFDDTMRASMKEESLRFLEHVVFEGAGDLDTMLQADYTFVDANLAGLYGVEAPTSGFAKTSLDPTRRAGILTHAGVLALNAKPNESSPTARGKFVRERLFCQVLPEPPPEVDTTPPEVDPTLTTRERFNQHMTDPVCASCHRLTDNIGYGFEHYDALGAWRDDENGLPIDDSGSVVDTPDGDIAFDGAVELAETLADNDDVRACFVQQWFTFAQGRGPESVDSCTLDALVSDFMDSQRDVRSLLVAITKTQGFRARLATEGER